MRYFPNPMSHRKHRSAPWGQTNRGHRTEIARLLAKQARGSTQRMYASMGELMKDRRGGGS